MARVRIASLDKRYGGRPGVVALRKFSLDVADGSCVAILGPSGCGKTTLLRVIAGLERPDAGSVRFDERDVVRLPPERRGVGMVFAHDALFPHLSVRDNLAYGLRGHGLSASTRDVRVRDAARRMRVDDLLERGVRTLSSGQRQRVAVARALAPSPAIVLLDEPFSRLDAPLRAALRVELSRVLRAARATALFVTHDQGEAMAVADTIAVMRDGRVEQSASPRELYDAPATTYVATFVGTPRISLVPAAALGAANPYPGATTLGFRSDAVVLCGDDACDIAGIVSAVEDFGADAYAYVETPLGTLAVRHATGIPRVGERVSLRFDRSRAHPFDADGIRLRDFARV